jgi:hypothetical protein
MIWGSKYFWFGKQGRVCQVLVASAMSIFGLANIFVYTCDITNLFENGVS